MIKMTGKIYIIGIGPGASEYLTKKAIDTVKMSDYTVGSTRAIELFDDVQNKLAFNVKELLDTLEKESNWPLTEMSCQFYQPEIQAFPVF